MDPPKESTEEIKEHSVDDTLYNLVQLSKKLTDAKLEKAEIESQLQQLTFFSNFTDLIKGNENEILGSIFRFTHQVIPNIQEGEGGDSIRLSVENVTEELCFDSRYWHFNISFSENVSVWKLESSLGPGSRTSFCTKYLPLPNYAPVQIQISLVFSMELTEETPLLRVFNFSSILVDILDVLSADRRVPTSNQVTTGPPYFLRLEDDNPVASTDLPPLLTFHLKGNRGLCKAFVPLILSTCRHRGFPDTLFHGTDSQVTAHVDQERIQISLLNEGIQITAFNSNLLVALKVAVIKRLLVLNELRVKCPVDGDVDKLYRLKLKLESFIGGGEETEDFTELYLILRNVMEGVQFQLGSESDAEEDVIITDSRKPEIIISRPVRLPIICSLDS